MIVQALSIVAFVALATSEEEHQQPDRLALNKHTQSMNALVLGLNVDDPC